LWLECTVMRLVFILLVGVLAASPVLAEKKKGGPPDVSYAAKQKGLKVLKTLTGDFDGDGADDVIGACTGKRGVQLCVFSAKPPIELVFLGEPANGKQLGKLELVELFPPTDAVEVILEHYDTNPDEKIKRVRVYSGFGKPRVVFKNAIFRSKDKSKRPQWETLPGVVKYGDARPGWYFVDTDDNGTSEVVVRTRPQLLQVPRDGGDAYLLTGVREKVWEFLGRPDSGTYVEPDHERFNEFLPAYEIEKVTGSSAWVPKDLKQELESQAMAEAVYQAAEGENPDDLPEKVDIDYAPFFKEGADGKLETAWIEDAGGVGVGEYLELQLAEERPIHMVRIVSGCVKTKQTFRSHNVPTKFEVALGTRDRAFVDREEPKRPLKPAIGILEVPVKDKRFAKQTLIFFKGDIETDRVRVTLRAARELGRASRTCLSEVSVH
jgi:hypothetical protein